MATNTILPPQPPPDVPIVCQLSSSLQMLHHLETDIKIIEVPGVSQPKLVKFSHDGLLLGCIDSKKLTVFQVSDYKIIFCVEFTKEFSIQEFSFSPRSTFITTYEQYNMHHNANNIPNVKVCRLDPTNESEGLANKVAEFTHTHYESWEPQWTEDETLFAKQSKECLNVLDTVEWVPTSKPLELKNLLCFKLAKQYKDTPLLAVFVKGYRSVPCSACIYKHRSLKAPIANKTFFNADSATLSWNHSGTALLVVAQIESSINYYGGQSLYYLSTDGISMSVDLDKKGPIYSTDWHPNRHQFAIVYGLMPSRARIYNHKCEPLITLPEMHRNVVKYNPQGNLLCFAGFGGLKGVMEFWDVERRVKISSAEATDTTYCEWCPDGSRFLTATLSPRLFEGNGFKVWDYKGKMLNNYLAPERELFWSISWRQFPPGVLPPPQIQGVKGTFLKKASDTYIPPNLRDRNAAAPADKLDDEQKGKKKGKDAKSDNSKKVPPAVVGAAGSDTRQDLDRKLRGLNKKLRDINKLKEMKEGGTELLPNQEVKIASEADIRAQIEALEISDPGPLDPRVVRKYKDTTPDNWRRDKLAD